MTAWSQEVLWLPTWGGNGSVFQANFDVVELIAIMVQSQVQNLLLPWDVQWDIYQIDIIWRVRVRGAGEIYFKSTPNEEYKYISFALRSTKRARFENSLISLSRVFYNTRDTEISVLQDKVVWCGLTLYLIN